MRLVLPILLALSVRAGPLFAQDPAEQDTAEAREEAEFDAFIDALNASEAAAMTPGEVAAGNGQPGVQDGGVHIDVVAPGTPQTLARGDSVPADDPRDVRDPDDPRDAPPPTIYGEEICPTNNVRGQFEPAQGTWQDDPTFEDRPGKQIVRLSPNLFRAELKMVTERWSLLHGIERAVGGADPRRDEIFVEGEATGTGRIPVKFRFTLKQLGRVTIIYESEILGEIPIGEPCRPDAVLPFEVTLDATDGIPPRGSFLFKQDGEYLLEAELVTQDGGGTGIKIGVLGNAVTTHAPSLAFRPVTVLHSALEDVLRPQMEETVRELSDESARRIPDFFPIVNDERLVTKTFPLRDRRDLVDNLTKNRTLTQMIEGLGTELMGTFLRDAIREELTRELQLGALMSGFDRLVVLTTDHDFRLIWMGSLTVEPDAVAFAPSQKVVFVNLDVAGDVYTVAHEIVHTLPFSFAEEEMVAECGLNYHGNAAENLGHGHQVSFGGRPRPARRDGSPHIMGSEAKGVSQWITQCTYWHVLEVLSKGVPDPRVLLVQGFVGRHEGRSGGALLPLYELDGVEDLPAGGAGGWAIVLRDATGNELARHAWEPQWRIADGGRERNLIGFAFRLLLPEGLARVDLEGPGGVLDSRVLSSTAPTVAIVSPAEGTPAAVVDGGVRVEWKGADADGDPLLYTVLYSSDAGRTWMDVEVETDATSVVVPIDPEAPEDAHRVLVRVTDGGRSSDASTSLVPAGNE